MGPAVGYPNHRPLDIVRLPRKPAGKLPCFNRAMGVLEQYRAQYRWRSWHAAYAQLPPLRGARILDLGCGPGDQARDLAAMGARVHGIDADAQLIAHANA